MSLILVSGPALEPVVIDDITERLGYGPYASLDSTTQTMLSGRITPLIAMARAMAEDYLRRALITQTWQYLFDGFPGYDTRYTWPGYPAIIVPKPPLQSIVSLQYVDVSGALQTLSQDASYGVNEPGLYAYQLDPGSETQPARLFPPYARPWPPTRMVPNNVQLEFIAGYGDAATNVPPQIAGAIKFLVEWLYENGGMQDAPLPQLFYKMLDPYRNLIA